MQGGGVAIFLVRGWGWGGEIYKDKIEGGGCKYFFFLGGDKLDKINVDSGWSHFFGGGGI